MMTRNMSNQKPANQSNVGSQQNQTEIVARRSTLKDNANTLVDVQDKRVFIMDQRFKTSKPVAFSVKRDEAEKLTVFHCSETDMFFQMQESVHENSMFIGDQILKGEYFH